MEKLGLRPNDESLKWYAGGNESTTLELPRKVLSSQTEFERKVGQKVSSKTYNNHQAITLADLEERVKHVLQGTEAAKVKWLKGRTKASVNVQNFVSNFSDFLACYAGIVEIVKGADQQYGGIAYGTMSIMLTVVVNKQRKEKKIEETLLAMQAHLPRMETTKELYPSEKIELRIGEVYSQVLLFLRKSTEYYQRPGYVRLWQAITRPSQKSFDIVVDEIARKIAEVKEERDLKLHEGVKVIQDELTAFKIETGRDFRDVKADIQQLSEHKEQAHLHELRSMLVSDTYNPDEHLSCYQQLLHDIFGNEPSCMGMVNLERQEAYTQWRSSPESCMLCLSGQTRTQQTGLCWLSPALPQVVKALRREGQQVVYHFPQRVNFMVDDVPAHEMLSSIVYQLLCLKPEMLRDRKRFESLKAKLRGGACQNDDVSLLCGVLRKLFQEVGSVYVILDRMDRCKCRGRTQRLIENLLNAIERTDCTIKVLVLVAPDQTGRVEIDISEELIERKRYIEINGWDQEYRSPGRRKRYQ